MSDYKGMPYLKNKLENKRSRVLLRYEYYEMKKAVKDLSDMMPPNPLLEYHGTYYYSDYEGSI